jgi:hypothetical protein
MTESVYSCPEKLMTGPDGIVYRLPGNGGLVYPDPDSVAHGTVPSPVVAAPELATARNTLRAQLAHLPQFDETSPC